MTAAPLPRVIAFGASISAWSFGSSGGKGFGDVLRKHFEGRAVVENEDKNLKLIVFAGFPGGTTISLRPEFARILSSIHAQPTRPISIFTIFIGANDAVEGSSQHVPLPQYAVNIRTFISTLLTDPSPALKFTRILLITPPPIGLPDPLRRYAGRHLSEAQEKIFRANLGKSAREGPAFRAWVAKMRYAEMILSVAKEFESSRVCVVDVWRGIMQLAGYEQLKMPLDVEREEALWTGCGLPGAGEFERNVFVDGLHFGEKANAVLSEEIMRIVRDL